MVMMLFFEFVNAYTKYRDEALKHFFKKNKIIIQIKSQNTIYKNITAKYYIGERILAQCSNDDNDNTHIRTFLLQDYYYFVKQYQNLM